MLTDIIRYNLKDRMRQFNGAVRNFDVPAVVKAVNSPKVQERVRLGDLNGFYGHWARTKFGAEPGEGGVLDGKVVNLEPCFRTVYLKAYDDGTIEHQAEFLPTDAGLKAWNQIQAKSGGFSSVIGTQGGISFHGFDFVREPNFSGNRPYTLDSTEDEVEPLILVLDDVGEHISDEFKSDYIEYLLDSISQYQNDVKLLTKENMLLNESLHQLHLDHSVLLDEIALAQEKQEIQSNQSKFVESVALDNVIQQANKFKTDKIEPAYGQTSQIESAEMQLMKSWW